MFDPKKAALLILSGKHGEEEGGDPEEGGANGPEALKAVFEAARKGDFDAAYDALRAVVETCSSDNEGEELGPEGHKEDPGY